MKGWTIFTHSVRLVLSNLEMALRVSLVLYLLQAAYHVMAFMAAPEAAEPSVFAPSDPVFDLPLLLLGLGTIVSSLWIAVAWHRYVLVEEMPAGWLPRWHGDKILGYLGRSIMLGLLIFLVLAVTMVVVVVLPALQAFIMPGLVLAGSYFFFRLGVMLPAGAVGEKLSVAECWSATRDKDGAIVVLAVLMMAGTFILQVPSLVSGNLYSPITLVYNLVTGWFATMIGVSILTTLYGHYVQGRSID
ncbi:hypothetical protein ACN2XU_09450 [Primorskyibacter sp. 2E107]|uniref:hypothetical protein n=1 Tax=Primorskyibacter sp. 2E107 TaxID=3403458 RepID=UPI003AF54D24